MPAQSGASEIKPGKNWINRGKGPRHKGMYLAAIVPRIPPPIVTLMRPLISTSLQCDGMGDSTILAASDRSLGAVRCRRLFRPPPGTYRLATRHRSRTRVRRHCHGRLSHGWHGQGAACERSQEALSVLYRLRFVSTRGRWLAYDRPSAENGRRRRPRHRGRHGTPQERHHPAEPRSSIYPRLTIDQSSRRRRRCDQWH